MTEKMYISWSEFHKHVKELATILKEYNFDQIVAVSRGGLIPAGILAYELNIRNTQTINISTYDDMNKRPDHDIQLDTFAGVINNKTLVVDDLADSGRTIKILKQKYPQAYYACVYAKPKGKDTVNKYAVSLPDKWIVFPWD